MKRFLLVAAACFAYLAGAAAQDVPESAPSTQAVIAAREQSYLVPVALPRGRTAQLHARLCRPVGEEDARLVVINHGTPPVAADRAKVKLGRCDQEAAQWFLRRGYAVAFALRRGYGETGGADEENQLDCRHADFVRAGIESAIDVDAVVKFFTTQFPHIRSGEAVVVGQSTGGWATIAYDSLPHPKVSAFVNMAGGRGGHHDRMPNDNCRPDLLTGAAQFFGRTASTRMLWIYTSNDTFFGPSIANSLYRAFTGAGGKAEFHQLGPFGADGHRLFFGEGGSEIWGPIVEEFLNEAHGPAMPTRAIQDSGE